MDEEADLTLGSKKEQAELLTAVLKASDDDADEEVLQTSVGFQLSRNNHVFSNSYSKRLFTIIFFYISTTIKSIEYMLVMARALVL